MNDNDKSTALEGLKLISDWAKWLITIESAAIALIGTVINADKGAPPHLVKILITVAIVCFLVSIAAAALLLLSLPEIVQNLRSDRNIWMTQDSIIGRVFHATIQGFAILESLFFGLGLVCFSAAVIAATWSPRPSSSQPPKEPLPSVQPVDNSRAKQSAEGSN